MSTVESDIILNVDNLKVEFDTYGGIVKAVRGVSFSLKRGKTLAIVGESGCGKSVTVQALMGLIPIPPGRVTSGAVQLNGREILSEVMGTQSAMKRIFSARRNAVRGREIGMIFQDPMTSLNPTMTIGKQIVETLRAHEGISIKKGRERAIELLEQVQIPEADTRVDQYPFELSGGMRQRVMIAMAIACNPSVLIADEPTTALDVTIQAQILNLLQDLQKQRQMSIILITHDLGVVARMANDVAVMYGGQIVEQGSVDEIFFKASHPYTVGLRAAMPEAGVFESTAPKTKLLPIEGSPPDLFSPPKGCSYFDRCPHAMKICADQNPTLWNLEGEHISRCWLHHSRAPVGLTSTLYRSGLMDGEVQNG